LIAVSDLNRSIDFYREIGPFQELLRDDAVAVLGDPSPESIMLILRETRSNRQARHGPQSLGLRTVTFNVGSQAELDRIEAVLHRRGLFTSRRSMAEGASDLLNGRDPDNLPVTFVRYDVGATIGADYYRSVMDLFYSLDT
jgi:catechol-2,3-dioxygenase